MYNAFQCSIVSTDCSNRVNQSIYMKLSSICEMVQIKMERYALELKITKV